LGKRKTTAEFIQDAVDKHGTKYNYSKVVYVRSQDKVEIICNIHKKNFWQQANSHLRGVGCPLCNPTLAKDTSWFITRAKSLHGNKYSYGLVKYSGSFDPVEITCRVHGGFLQTPAVHLSKGKSGCRKCSIEKNALSATITNEQFISRSTEVHAGVYNYSDTLYVSTYSKVDILCTKCNKHFTQRPSAHLQGRGCPLCASSGYRASKGGYLYIMTAGDITKVGVTNCSTSVRSKFLSKKSGLSFTVEFERFWADGSIARSLEATLLRYLRENYIQIDSKFNGSTECFVQVDKESLYKKIEEITKEL
jgi:Zn finger protein HypA/HybF involved in hydrogenase expression